MKFSIVTPSFNSLGYLRRCCASVADQAGVEVEHIVVDGGSTDGTVAWLRNQAGLRWISEPDRGMYDAVNKGFRLAHGEVLAYLNADEQYLPGTLRVVGDGLARRPDLDGCFGDALIVRPDGSLIAYRKSYPLRWPYIMVSHLYVLSCTLFWRRRLVEEACWFDPAYCNRGDQEWVVRLLRRGFKVRRLPRYLAAFTMTGANLSAAPSAQEERRRLWGESPAWVRGLAPALNAMRWAEKWCAGAFRQAWPMAYELYIGDDLSVRRSLKALGGSFRWSDGRAA